MKLELPDNNASVLFHMGNALQSIAKDLDVERVGKLTSHVHTGVSGMTPDEISDTVDKMIESVAADWKVPVNRLTGNTTDAEQYGKSLVDFDEIASEIPDVSDTIDADGLPWDQRIHSRGKTRLDDNTWRMARKPKDKTDEEWAEYVEGVKTELRELMAIPVTVTYDPNEADPFAADAVDVSGVEFKRLPGVIREVEIHGTIVTPPVDAAVIAPPVDAAVIAPPVDAAVIAPPVDAAVIAPPVDAAVMVPPVDAAVMVPPVDAAVIAPPVDAAVIAPPVDAAVIVRPTFEEAVEIRGESVKAYVDAVDGLINKINATPPVVTPPIVDAPVVTGPTTFPELMKFITVNNKKLTKESVDEALKAQGLASIALLAARTDLIPQVHAALVKLL